MSPQISVIVTNFNGKKFLKDCFASILKEKSPSYEIIFIDDCSTDGSFEYAKKNFGKNNKFRFFQTQKNVGTSKVFNLALKKSKGRYLFYLNNDTILKAGWTTEIKKGFEKYPRAAVLQGKIYRMGTHNYDYAGDFMGPLGFLIERAQGARDKGQFDSIDRIFSIKGTCMIVRKSALVRIGGFDEDYKFGLDETDMTWRCWLMGYETLFYPSITVWHYFGTKRKGEKYYRNAKIYYEGCKNTIATLYKNFEFKRLVTVLPLNILCWFLLGLAFIIKLDFYRGFSLLKGIGWNLLHIVHQYKKRSIVQKMRTVSDDNIFSIVGTSRNLYYYFQKGYSYIMGKPF